MVIEIAAHPEHHGTGKRAERIDERRAQALVDIMGEALFKLIDDHQPLTRPSSEYMIASGERIPPANEDGYLAQAVLDRRNKTRTKHRGPSRPGRPDHH